MEEDHAPPGPKFETPLQLIVDHTNLARPKCAVIFVLKSSLPHTPCVTIFVAPFNCLDQIRVLWERSLAISQRLELAHKELVRLRSLGLWTTEGAQLRLTYSLEDEIHRMGAVKPQLEAALAQAILERSLRESQRKGPGHGKRTHGDVHWNQEESPSVTWQCTVVRQITAMSPSGLGGGFVVAESTPAQCPHVHQRKAKDSGECHILSSHFNFEGEG